MSRKETGLEKVRKTALEGQTVASRRLEIVGSNMYKLWKGLINPVT